MPTLYHVLQLRNVVSGSSILTWKREEGNILAD